MAGCGEGGKRAVVAGNSIGGYCALAVGAAYPELCLGVASLNGAGRFSPNPEQAEALRLAAEVRSLLTICYLLLPTAYYYLLLPTTTYYYLLLPTTTCVPPTHHLRATSEPPMFHQRTIICTIIRTFMRTACVRYDQRTPYVLQYPLLTAGQRGARRAAHRLR